MEKRAVYSMTEGNTVKLLLGFTVPMLIGNLFQQLYNMVDSIVVGRYVGANALAAVGATGSLNYMFFALSLGIAVGVGVVVSQNFGADRMDMVEKGIINGMYLLMAGSLIMSIIGVVSARWVLMLLDTPEAILDDAVIYMRVTCGGILATAAYNGVSSILRALGDSKTPLYFMLLSCFINIGLDLLFVMVFNWAVFGVALATIIAQIAAAVGSFAYAILKIPCFRIKRQNRSVRMDIISKCFTLGLPIALQNALIAFSCIFLQKVVNGFGESVVAANTALSRIEQLVQQPYSSLGTAITTYTGQNMGAGQINRVKKGFKVGVCCVVVFSLAMLLPCQLLSSQIVGIFVTDTDVISIGSTGLRITSCFYMLLGMIYVARGLLNGAGDAIYSMINGIMEVTCRVCFAIILTRIPAIGMWGVFFTTGLTWSVTGLVSVARYLKGKWQFKQVVS